MVRAALDAAHPCRQVNHGIRALDDSPAVRPLHQVEARGARHDDLASAVPAKPLDHAGAEKAAAAGDHHATGEAAQPAIVGTVGRAVGGSAVHQLHYP